MIAAMHLGFADHFGWSVVVAATDHHEVVDRRRVELVEPGVTPAPIHYDSAALGVDEAAALVATVRASVARATAAAFDELAAALPHPVASIALRALPRDFPTDISILRRAPYEARADAVMYRQVLAAEAERRGWDVRFYDAKDVVARAVVVLGDRAHDVLDGPRASLGPPWTQDHRVALAATIVS